MKGISSILTDKTISIFLERFFDSSDNIRDNFIWKAYFFHKIVSWKDFDLSEECLLILDDVINCEISFEDFVDYFIIVFSFLKMLLL